MLDKFEGGKMQLIVTGKNLHVSKSLKAYTEKKITRLDRYLPAPTNAHVVFSKEKTKKDDQTHRIQVTVQSNGSVLHGEQRSTEFPAAVDGVMEKLYKEIERSKGKHSHHREKQVSQAVIADGSLAGASDLIVRRKHFATPAMTEKQAIKAMDKLGHEFYLFLNKSTDSINVIYRRTDGNYGLIQPDPED
jgi:ribosome hibernation promoting factor